jgi:2'-5' RNA ligase
MHANWFVAVTVPGAEIAARLSAPPRGVRCLHADDFHLTIAFLGACGPERARRGFDALVWPLGALDVTLGEVVPMGSPHRFSALSALLVQGRAEVESAMGVARAPICAAAGVAVDPRPPKAHVTIARPARRASATERDTALRWARALPLAGVRVRLAELALYTWSEDRRERLFRRVEVRRLGEDGPGGRV